MAEPEPEDGKPDGKPDDGSEPKMHTQAEVDRIVAERLARERGKFSDYSDLKAKAAKYDEMEESNKSEVERANARTTAAEAKADAAEARAMRLEVATAKGLSSTQARRLQGATKEELEADADDLLASFKPEGGTAPPSSRPTPDLKGGTEPNAEPDEMDPRKLAEKIGRPL